LIVFQREGPGQIVLLGREVLAANQIRREGMTVGCQILEQTAEAD